MAPMTQPPVIPVSHQGSSAVGGTSSQATIWVLAGKAQDAFNLALAQKRPWAELVDRTQLAKPESFSEAITRTRKNWYYFRINYSLVLAGVVALSLIFNPGALFFLLALFAAWVYLYLIRSEPIVIYGRTFSEREVLLGMSLFTIIMIFMTSVGSILITALLIGGAICSAHGAYRVPDDLFLDEQETTGGFLSFLTSGNGVPQVMSHV
ncbi:PRA1 family protein B4 [Physcomitrium patens]|uniref:PRA1 family protein n=1 Tax=Physcomitrium patens TaxID=3218 RepID=A0A2K1L1S7_PHYPA|nr:PRA1 family protein B4-like [Physcomitrium patens]PNR59978.1 hypothetical protein PHYPA_002770 [Physcomitrium patens]|eukprot:XP_024369196.1 PRA1 family protein B4-like [Physcomitrella patens]